MRGCVPGALYAVLPIPLAFRPRTRRQDARSGSVWARDTLRGLFGLLLAFEEALKGFRRYAPGLDIEPERTLE